MRVNGRDFHTLATTVEALRAFRLTWKTRTLWIDAVCINQEDFDERAQQVAMMGLISENSFQTLVWLGLSEDDERTDRAFDLCRNVAPQLPGVRKLFQFPHWKQMDAACESIPCPGSDSIDLLNLVFDRPWFSRLWVWQEVGLSPRSSCHIGNFSIPFETLVLVGYWVVKTVANNAFWDHSVMRAEVVHALFLGMILVHGPSMSDGVPLSTLMGATQDCETLDPRDRIYG